MSRGGARPISSWSAGRATALALLLLTVAPPLGAAYAAAGGPADNHGAATQDGWWNRLQGPADGEPDGNPVRPLVPPAPKPPTVPADAIATSATAGQIDKVAAVGVDVTLADGAALDGLILRLKEAPGGGANMGAEGAKVTACPATVPWGPGQNAAWRERPTADCSLAAIDGVRGADGVWTFDLTPIARLWTDPFAPLAPDGVVLAVDPARSPGAVQVSWLNVDSGGGSVDLRATPPVGAPGGDGGQAAPAPAAAAAPAPTGPYLDGAVEARAFGAPAAGRATGPSAFSSGLPTSAGGPPAGPAAGSPPPEEVTLAAGPPHAAPTLRVRPAVDFWEHVPAPTALLIPFAAGLAVLIGVVLGPMGRPSPVFRREGGFSRALARRGPTGPDPGLHPAATRWLIDPPGRAE